jgi:hypothetical protein
VHFFSSPNGGPAYVAFSDLTGLTTEGEIANTYERNYGPDLRCAWDRLHSHREKAVFLEWVSQKLVMIWKPYTFFWKNAQRSPYHYRGLKYWAKESAKSGDEMKDTHWCYAQTIRSERTMFVRQDLFGLDQYIEFLYFLIDFVIADWIFIIGLVFQRFLYLEIFLISF